MDELLLSALSSDERLAMDSLLKSIDALLASFAVTHDDLTVCDIVSAVSPSLVTLPRLHAHLVSACAGQCRGTPQHCQEEAGHRHRGHCSPGDTRVRHCGFDGRWRGPGGILVYETRRDEITPLDGCVDRNWTQTSTLFRMQHILNTMQRL